MMKGCCLLLIMIGIAMASPALAAEEICEWQGYPLREVQAESSVASNRLTFTSFDAADTSLATESIKYAKAFGDQIVVWHGESLLTPVHLCVYDPFANFLYGYEIMFAAGNGVTNISMYDGDVLLFVSSAQRIYRLSADEQKVRYYEADPKDFDIYTTQIVTQSVPQVHKVTNNSVDVIWEDGTITKLFGSPETSSYASEQAYIIITGAIILCAGILVWCVKNTHTHK